MSSTVRKFAVVAGVLAVLVVDGGCGGAPKSNSAATVKVSPNPSSTAAPSAGPSGSTTGDIQLPEFPVPVIPDVTSLTKKASATEKMIKASVPIPRGLTVTGARCSSSGQIVNRAGVSQLDGVGGGQVSTGSGVKQRDKDGSGQFTDGGVTYQVDKDGSGQVSSGDATLQVDADGSGQYSDDDVTYQVDADGSGQYQSRTDTYQVDKDGSGQWESDQGTVANDGDGSGTWVGPQGTVTVNGDGTGDVDGRAIKIAPMPKFALLGKLPKLKTLGPLGKACGTLIRIDASLLFDFDKATVRPAAGPVLAAVAKALRKTRGPVQVNGYTDAKGSDSYNLDLSNRRAAAVVKALQSDGLTVPMDPQGFGESHPVAPNSVHGQDNPAGRQLNRRVELVLP